MEKFKLSGAQVQGSGIELHTDDALSIVGVTFFWTQYGVVVWEGVRKEIRNHPQRRMHHTRIVSEAPQ